MAYTPPAGDNANFSWVDSASYTAPAGDNANFSWAPDFPTGSGAATVPVQASGSGTFNINKVFGSGAATVTTAAAGTGTYTLPKNTGAGAATVATEAAGQGTVVRYELRGSIRKDGLFVDRTVRAHRLSDGALIAEVMSEDGRFRLAVGFAPEEFYVLPLDMTAGAEDNNPPAVNHVISELADDNA